MITHNKKGITNTVQKSLYYIFLGLSILLLNMLWTSPAQAEVNHCGHITENQTWSSADNVHTIGVGCESVTVDPYVTLTITEGAIVKFALNRILKVDGTLRVLGSEANPVYFTSYLDDTIGGDTNGDSDATLPARGDWDYIRFGPLSDDANSIINHAIIRYGGHIGTLQFGALTLIEASPTIQNSEITDNTYCAIRANLLSFPTLDNNILVDNAANGLCMDGGTIDSDATWSISDTSYFLRDDITISFGATLTVDPDVVVKMGNNRIINVDGALRVLGTSDHPVYFTSHRDDTIGGDTNDDGGAILPVRGDWDYIRFGPLSDDANSIINHAIIRYGGHIGTLQFGALTLIEASPTIQNSEITDNTYCAIRTNLKSFPTLNNNILVDNAANGICIDGGTINNDATWSISDTSYFLRDDITISFGSTLTVDPGVVVKMGNNRIINIDGALRVFGTSDHPVYFTSHRDDTIGGDTNGDGGATSPAMGDWDYIRFGPLSDDANSIINHAIIRYGGHIGTLQFGALTLIEASPTIQNSEITDNTYCAIRANLKSFPTLDNNILVDNAANGLCMDGGTIDSDATWSISDTSYFLRGDITITFGSTLNIDPGVVVKMEDSLKIEIDGALRVLGTSDHPVYFTSYLDDSIGGDTNGDSDATSPTMGDWDYIRFNDSSDDLNSMIDHTFIRYGGHSGRPNFGAVTLIKSSPTIQNSEITDNTYCAIRAHLLSFPTLDNNILVDNAANGLCMDGGTIDGDANWSISDTSYFLRGDITISFGATLTVDPDVIVKMGDSLKIEIDGALRVLGTSDHPVYFTSYLDDSIGGDTNGDGDATSPTMGDWDYIRFSNFSDDANSVIDHAIIRHGGHYGTPNFGAVTLDEASPKLINSTITANNFAGILLNNSSPNIHYSEISNNQNFGIRAINNSTPGLICNDIYNNSQYGLSNTTPATVIIAEAHWWGTPSGPYHIPINPVGTGNAVSDGVDFVPWMLQSCLQEADLVVIKSDTPDPVFVDATLTYAIDITNHGPNTATDVVLTDILPAEVDFITASNACDESNGLITCNLNMISDGETKIVTIEVAAPPVPMVITNRVEVSANERDPQPSNNSTQEETTVIPINGDIDGMVELQGRSDHSGAEVCAWESEVLIDCKLTDASGYYILTLPQSLYNITIEMESYLDTERSGVNVIANDTITLNTVNLPGGDTNEDDVINIQDVTSIGIRYPCSCGDPCYDASADINNDCIINAQDLAITGANYLETSPVPWP
jgi:uncharacterized repeat protein (TIGR01451 family)